MQTMSRNFLLVLALGTVAVGAGCGGTEADTAAETVRSVPVKTATAQTRDLAETLTLTGTLNARAQVMVAPEVSARLVQTLKAEGDHVSKGELIAVLDDGDFKLARDRAKASLALADANLAHSRAEKERADSLLKTGGITDKDHLAAEVSVQLADASHSQATTELAIAERQLGRARIVAPISGHVTKKMVDTGTMAMPASPIYTIVDDAVFDFRASVASGDFGKLKVGSTVTMTADALPGFSFDGKVDRIAPQVDARSRSFEVVIQVPGRKELVSGLFARAAVHVRDVPGAVVVPPAALVRDGANPTHAQAFAIVGGKAERRDVTIGVEVADAIQVTDGIKIGDVVVLDPPSALGPGTQVEVQKATQPGS